MNLKNSTSLKSQLMIIILSVTLISIFMAFSFSIIYDYISARGDLKNEMTFSARLIAENCKSPLLFHDTLGTREILSSFKSMPMVLSAHVLDEKDSVVTCYRRDPDTKCPSHKNTGDENVYFDKAGLHISLPIMQDNRLFGRFTLFVSTGHIQKKFLINLLIFLAVFLIIMGVSYLMALRLQRIISGPILELKDLAEHITHDSDYSIRIPHTRGNEIGLLQLSFATMVQQLNKNILSLKNEIDFRIKAEQEARHLRTYLSSIIDSISSVIITVDQDGVIQQINKEGLRFLDKKPEELLGKPAYGTLPVLHGKENIAEECSWTTTPQSFISVDTTGDSSQPRYFNVALFPLSHTENEGTVIVIDDISEKTRMENMMIQNEKMMSLGGLAAGMAHEINNPLGIISQGIQNILRHISPDLKRNRIAAEEVSVDLDALYLYLENRKVIHYLKGILSSSKRASEIVTNMLQFSRQGRHSKTRIKVSDVIDQAIVLAENEYELKKKYDFRHINLKKEYDRPHPEAFCNVTEIQQVILNLLKNAAHALYELKGDGFTPAITIRCKNLSQQVRIEVEDNGPGIPDTVKPRIFEPFFTTKETGVGTGLGLSVSFFIITKNHGGTLEFESESGRGTRFIISLPSSR
jgi:PAS domain S-box-containing protein